MYALHNIELWSYTPKYKATSLHMLFLQKLPVCYIKLKSIIIILFK